MKTTSKPHWQTQYTVAASNFWNLFRFNNQLNLFSLVQDNTQCTLSRVFLLVCWVRGRRQAHNPTLAKILRLTYNRSCSHNRPQTAACNAVYSISRRALLITRLGEQLPRPRQVSMPKMAHPIQFMSCSGVISLWVGPKKKCILRGSNPRGLSPLGLKSSALTTRPRMRHDKALCPSG